VPWRARAACRARGDNDDRQQGGGQADRGDVAHLEDEHGAGHRAREHGGDRKQAAHEGETVPLAEIGGNAWNPARADSDADREKPLAPARANPTNTTFPVMFATKTRPRLRMLTASTTPVSTVSTSMSAGSGP
jgi:hypothetical protein